MPEHIIRRRDFLATGAGMAAAVATAQVPILGASDRLRLGFVGLGARGTYLINEAIAADPNGIEIAGLCDVWAVNRDRAAAMVAQKRPNDKPKVVARHQDLLAMRDLDALVIATPDHAHTPTLIDAIRAGKDAFVEKPLSATLQRAVDALDVVEKSDRIVQVGTQRRSMPVFQEAARYVKSGALGQVTKVETAWNRNVASWHRPIDDVREQDVDWDQYLAGLPKRPFDPARFRRWNNYPEFTTGLIGLLGSHMIDVALWFMDDPFPRSAVSLGGIYAWKDGRELSDTAEYVLDYPKDWLLTFSSRLGSGPEEDYEVFFGKERKLDSRDWISRTAAHVRPADAKDVTLPAPTGTERSHMGNFLDCMRSRKAPNAPIQVGYAHAVACCLGREAERTGRRVRYDAASRRIVDATN